MLNGSLYVVCEGEEVKTESRLSLPRGGECRITPTLLDERKNTSDLQNTCVVDDERFDLSLR